MNPTLGIRRATPDDAQLLSDLGELAFRAAFAKDNRPEDMDAYVAKVFDVGLLRKELGDPGIYYLIAVDIDDQRPHGYAKLRTEPTDPCVQGDCPMELERLYAHPDSIGTGVGRALMDAAMELAKIRGYKTLWLGVWEHNARAISFYKRFGFTQSGEHPFVVGTDVQTDLILEKTLDSVG